MERGVLALVSLLLSTRIVVCHSRVHVLHGSRSLAAGWWGIAAMVGASDADQTLAPPNAGGDVFQCLCDAGALERQRHPSAITHSPRISPHPPPSTSRLLSPTAAAHDASRSHPHRPREPHERPTNYTPPPYQNYTTSSKMASTAPAASVIPSLAERPVKNTICLFDVDGTLTPARRVSLRTT